MSMRIPPTSSPRHMLLAALVVELLDTPPRAVLLLLVVEIAKERIKTSCLIKEDTCVCVLKVCRVTRR
uniref:Putative secreted peptide n=1 Tax=Anopheles braziliensis TaxID=58242 RepID=A0A2M3ZUZ5_9DIPT